MVVQTYVPQAPLSTYIDYFWYFHGFHPSSEREVTLPDGTTDLIIDLREEKIQFVDHREKRLQLSHSILSGSHSEYFINEQSLVSTVIGIHFKPGGVAHFLNIPMDELHNEHVSIDVLWGGWTCLSNLGKKFTIHSPCFALKCKLLQRFLYIEKIIWMEEVLMTNKPMPKGFHTVTPYLHVQRADKLIDFLEQAFGAAELERTTDEAGVIRHAGVQLGDSIIECSEGNELYPPMHNALHVYVADTDECYRRALAAGATTLYEPAVMPYGERSAGVKDPFGNHWYIATYLGEEK